LDLAEAPVRATKRVHIRGDFMKKLLPLAAFAFLSAGPYPSGADELSDLRKAWRDCVDGAARYFATGTTEAADIVVQGAFGACESNIVKYASVVFSKTSSSDIDEFNRVVKSTELDARNSVIAIVLEERAMKQAPK
jgi:hypothetical protein